MAPRHGDAPSPGQVRGVVFNIQRFCTHDGPGIRTTVFLKGCPLRCQWCHNPEGLFRRREIAYDPSQCIGCRACLAACEHGAHEFLDDGQHLWLTQHCVRCGRCVETCYAGALEVLGEEKTASQVLEVVCRDRPYYERSGGGVTLSGGEPLLQPRFSQAILQLSRDEAISTALETSCAAPWSALDPLLPLVDRWMCDVKHMDAERHRALTGSDNQRTLDNLRRLRQAGATVLVRLPLVPGLNDDEANLRALTILARDVAPEEGIELMPYHRIGQSKYERTGRQYTLASRPEAGPDDLRRAARILRQEGVAKVFCQSQPEL